MGFFNKLFKTEKLTITDSDFGKIKSLNVDKNSVIWKFEIIFLNKNIDVFIDGNREEINETEKQILLNAIKEQALIKSQSERAIKEEFENAGMKFISLEKQFEISSISVEQKGFQLTFSQIEEPYYDFSVYFNENNQQMAVLIDS